jgi:predicted nucleic acid-binding protein
VIVIDASAYVDAVTEASARANAILARLETERSVYVPAVFDVEVLHALRRLETDDDVPASIVDAGVAELTELRAVRQGHAPLLKRIWELRHNLSAYDAAYVALAEALDAPLLTSDARLARSSGHEAAIELAPG